MPYYPAIHITSSHNSSNIWRNVQIMPLFIMQFHSLSYYLQTQKSKHTEYHYSHILSSLSSKSHTQFHTPASIKILGKHAHFCISEVTLSDSKAKYYVVCITPNSFPFHFFILRSLFLTTPPKYLRSSPPFQNVQH